MCPVFSLNYKKGLTIKKLIVQIQINKLDTNDADKKVYHQSLYYFSFPRELMFYNQ